MGDEQRDDAAPERVRADAYGSARIGAAAAFTLVLVVLLVLDVVVPGYDVSPATLLGREVTTVIAHLTNKAYGIPTRGAPRRIKAPILACIHITGNRRTAANPDRHQAARDERNYANRAGSNGPSAHYYVARDGWAIEAIDPVKYAAWSNADVASPNTANAGVAKVLAMRAKGFNANEAYWLEFECVGYASTYPITKAQKPFCATRVAAMAKAMGLPVNRATVHGHSDLNSVTRPSCPCPKTNREAFLGDVIARANAILRPPITTVTVKAGDTLSGIAAAHKLTLKALLAFRGNATHRANPGLIHPGDLVRVK